jgi:hypothetical protein
MKNLNEWQYENSAKARQNKISTGALNLVHFPTSLFRSGFRFLIILNLQALQVTKPSFSVTKK